MNRRNGPQEFPCVWFHCEAQLESMIRQRTGCDSRLSGVLHVLEEQRFIVSRMKTDYELQVDESRRQIASLRIHNESLVAQLSESESKLSTVIAKMNALEAKNAALESDVSSANGNVRTLQNGLGVAQTGNGGNSI